MPPKKVYEQKDEISHVLDRPDTYVGSKRLKKSEEFVAIKDDDGNFKIVKKYIEYSPAILRIFIEILSNAIDNVERSKQAKIICTSIKVNIDSETGETSVWNDGDIIPVEMNEKINSYNHSLIFGNMRTGSNYDDEQERLMSGRNGLGSKCLSKRTLVPCFDGSIKKVENIKIGEYLIGDDGTKRKVLNTIHGIGEMYEVSQSRGDSYTVNSEHILSLRMPDHKVIFWSTEKQGWQMVYLDAKNQKIHSKSIRALKSPGIECPECGIILSSNLNRHYRRIHKDKEIPKKKRKSPTVNPSNDCEEVRTAYIEMQKFAKSITDDNTIDISIQDYLKSNDTFKSRLTGFKSECVQWEKKNIELDPYVLGLWLGDGYQNGRGFAINAEDDYEILEYLKKWGEKNDATFTHSPKCINCKENKYDPKFIPCRSCAAFSINSIEYKWKRNKAPLKNLLKKYNLLEEKFIPIEYKVNDRDTRLKVLAGLIDSDGHVQKEREGRRINISQGMMHEKLTDDILYLARSLGFSASKIIRDVTWTYENKKRTGKCISINISGNGLEDIPTILPRKKCSSPLSHEVLNTGPVKIKKVENGEFVGLSIDGNERFVINDFTVTHNCTNIFSSKFTVKGLDPDNKKVLEQTWTNNMRETKGPKIVDTKLKTGFTKITYFPDFKRFDLEEYTDDIIQLYTKYIIDAAMLTKIKVYFNEELIPVNNLTTYSQLYDSPTNETLLIKNKNSEVLITPSNVNEFQAISFVNGVYTKKGGRHVDAFSEAIFRPIVEKFTKKDKPTVNIKDVKQFFRIFIVSQVVNPEFSSQDKLELTDPKIEAEIKQSEINKILKWSAIEDIQNIIKMKEMVVLKKSEKKKKGYTKIEGLDPANNAGGKLGYECSLILCEGLSAKTYAVAGIEKGVYGKTGRDWFGVLALRGKCLNVRNSTPATIAKNKVITDLVQALGIRHDLDYTDDKNFKTLSYGRVILLTDADSVTFDTPCILKNIETNEIEIKPICEINIDIWTEDKLTLKQYSICDKYLVWSDKGWTKIKGIMRHKVNKPIFRVLTHTGCVDVTEDHSLLNKMGKSITINDCEENQTELLHYKYVQKEYFDKNINEEYAYALGYFQADGCCVTDLKVKQKRKDGTITHSTNSKWIICCIEVGPLEKLKEIFEKYEDTNANIKEIEITHPNKQCAKCFKIFKDSSALKKHMNNKTPCNEVKLYFQIKKTKVGKGSFSEKSGREHKYILEAKGVRKDICVKYRNMFYNSLREKKVPNDILNSSIAIQKAFLDGFYAGDGDKGVRTTDRFDGEYKTQIMGLFQVLQNCGYNPSINCSDKKLNVYNILMSKHHDKPAHTIKKIIDVSKKYEDSYVYDLETDNHHFHSSIGNLIVHNCDGIHISSLIMNFFHSLFPSILERDEPFLVSMATPIVRVFNPKGDILFYDENRFRKFAEEQTKTFKSKYYKGLGTTKSEDVPDTFGLKMIEFNNDENSNSTMNKVFDKKYADYRKEWLANYDPNPDFSLDDEGEIVNMEISSYLNNELIKFSHSDCKRSIPSLFDGLKESQRKVLYAVKKRNLTYNKQSLKVAQLGGYVAEHTNYHHGEQNLYDTIIKMANEFPGSNNIPLLYRDGQFGSRNSGGKDAASARYIFTKMESVTPLIFRQEDDVLLEYVYDDGDQVEPKFYIPIIPMILVNGCTGIGTGWSSSIPCFNPMDIIKCIKEWLNNDGEVLIKDPDNGTIISLLSEIKPWYRHFQGRIEEESGKFVSYGMINSNKDKVEVTELPIGLWTDKFKESCEDWLVEKQIKNMKNYSTPKKVNFVVTESEDGMVCNIKNLGLYSYLHTTNMVLFNDKEQIKKYNVDQIINEFCTVRYNLYAKRKKHIIDLIEKELRHLGNKERFIQEIIDKKINIMNIDEDIIVKELEKRGYDKENNTNDEGEELTNKSGYEYLLKLPVRTLSSNQVNKIKNDILSQEKKLDNIKKTSEKKMWLNDLKEFEDEYMKWLKNMDTLFEKKVVTKEKKKKKVVM